MQRFQQLEMRLLTAATLVELVDTALSDCRLTFGLDGVSLMIYDPESNPSPVGLAPTPDGGW